MGPGAIGKWPGRQGNRALAWSKSVLPALCPLPLNRWLSQSISRAWERGPGSPTALLRYDRRRLPRTTPNRAGWRFGGKEPFSAAPGLHLDSSGLTTNETSHTLNISNTNILYRAGRYIRLTRCVGSRFRRSLAGTNRRYKGFRDADHSETAHLPLAGNSE